MENSRVLDRTAAIHPLAAAAVGTTVGAVFGLCLHVFTTLWGTEESSTPFIVGFACTGTVIGLSASYWSYIWLRLRHRHLDSGRRGLPLMLHGMLAGAFFFGGGSLVLSIAELPFQSGELRGSEWMLFLANSVFSLPGGLLARACGFSQAMTGELIHSNDISRIALGVLIVPIASGVFGAGVGLAMTCLGRLNR